MGGGVNSTANATTVIADAAHIEHALHNLISPGQVFEIRVLEGSMRGDRIPATYRGYFDHDHLPRS